MPVETRQGQYDIDREAAWGKGPWLDELDYRLAAGDRYIAVARRHIRYGTWCGYVAVPPGHPWNGLDWSDDGLPDMHGGCTWAEAEPPWHRSEAEWNEVRVEDIPGEEPFRGIYGGDGWWWIGFDCSHTWDYNPGMEKKMKELEIDWEETGTYRDFHYVTAQLFQLLQAAHPEDERLKGKP